MIIGKINLLMLKGAIKKMKAQSGEIECLILPIEKNNFFKGEKGIYLDIIGFELKNKREDSKDTHLIKQSLPKEVRDLMSQEDLNNMPIIGNLSVWNETGQPEPNINHTPIEEEDDLPF